SAIGPSPTSRPGLERACGRSRAPVRPWPGWRPPHSSALALAFSTAVAGWPATSPRRSGPTSRSRSPAGGSTQPANTTSGRTRPFKMGAFHIAMQAGVPLVPVVLRNAGQLMWRGEALVHPGTLQVAVLDPIPTASWRVEDLDDHIADVRRRFQAALEQWPTD